MITTARSRVPFPTSVCRSILPPWRSTMPYTTERPSPVPRSFVVKNGSKILERWSGGDPRAGILHLLLEPVHEQVELPLGRAQRARHLVERGGEDAELARPGDGHLELELVARDAPGRLHERRDRAHQVVAREHPDGEPSRHA